MENIFLLCPSRQRKNIFPCTTHAQRKIILVTPETRLLCMYSVLPVVFECNTSLSSQQIARDRWIYLHVIWHGPWVDHSNGVNRIWHFYLGQLWLYEELQWLSRESDYRKRLNWGWIKRVTNLSVTHYTFYAIKYDRVVEGCFPCSAHGMDLYLRKQK